MSLGAPLREIWGAEPPLKNSNISNFDEILIISIKFSKEDNGSGPKPLGAPQREKWGGGPRGAEIPKNLNCMYKIINIEVFQKFQFH